MGKSAKKSVSFTNQKQISTCCVLNGGCSTARRSRPSWQWKAIHLASWRLAPPVGFSPAPGYGMTALWSWSGQHLQQTGAHVSIFHLYFLKTVTPTMSFNQNTGLQEAMGAVQFKSKSWTLNLQRVCTHYTVNVHVNSYSSESACSIHRTKCIGSIQDSHVYTQGHGETKWVKL